MRTDHFVDFVMRRLKLRCDADSGVNMIAFVYYDTRHNNFYGTFILASGLMNVFAQFNSKHKLKKQGFPV